VDSRDSRAASALRVNRELKLSSSRLYGPSVKSNKFRGEKIIRSSFRKTLEIAQSNDAGICRAFMRMGCLPDSNPRRDSDRNAPHVLNAEGIILCMPRKATSTRLDSNHNEIDLHRTLQTSSQIHRVDHPRHE